MRRLLLTKNYVQFLVGRGGDFCDIAASAVRRLKRTVRSDNSSLVLVLPYPSAELKYNAERLLEFYDEIEVCRESLDVHYRLACSVRNRYMVNRSDLVVAYPERPDGGASLAVQYARMHEKCVINLHNAEP